MLTNSYKINLQEQGWSQSAKVADAAITSALAAIPQELRHHYEWGKRWDNNGYYWYVQLK
jgi:hypothetical protein